MVTQTRTKVNEVERRSERIQIADGDHRNVEHRFDVTWHVDGVEQSGVHKSAPLPDEFAVLVDSNGRRDCGELNDEQRAWLDAESSLEVGL